MKPQKYFYQAIETKYFQPTNHRPARIRASCDAKTVFVEWDHGLDPGRNHARAAVHLANMLHKKNPHGVWDYPLAGGQLKNGNYAWVFVEE